MFFDKEKLYSVTMSYNTNKFVISGEYIDIIEGCLEVSGNYRSQHNFDLFESACRLDVCNFTEYYNISSIQSQYYIEHEKYMVISPCNFSTITEVTNDSIAQLNFEECVYNLCTHINDKFIQQISKLENTKGWWARRKLRRELLFGTNWYIQNLNNKYTEKYIKDVKDLQDQIKLV